MADPKARFRVTEGGFNTSIPTSIVAGPSKSGLGDDSIACREWSISDDVMNLSDTASLTVPNVDGENSGKFLVGQKIEIEVSDDDVRNGEWCRAFTGLITEVRTGSDMSGGSVVQLTCQDLGWFLTMCCAKPLVNIKRKTFRQLLQLLLDPSWGIGEIRADNDLSRKIKHGRQVIVQNFKPILGAVLPYIQVEPGQKPADIILTYAARDGVLVNVAADGALVFFRPDFSQQALFSALYSGSKDPTRIDNNVLGRPELRESIDGLFSEVQVWSTVVIDPGQNGLNQTENPNAAFRHTTYPGGYQKAKKVNPNYTNPLPFFRREVISDPEAINDDLRWNRAQWKIQTGLNNSWEYTVQFDRHSQEGAFFCSDTMINVDDRVNKVKGIYYVQSVRRSQTLGEGTKATLVIRKPVLDPNKTALNFGGTKGSGKTKKRGSARLDRDIQKILDR
jgi:prophage tail gpP-like protein